MRVRPTGHQRKEKPREDSRGDYSVEGSSTAKLNFGECDPDGPSSEGAEADQELFGGLLEDFADTR